MKIQKKVRLECGYRRKWIGSSSSWVYLLGKNLKAWGGRPIRFHDLRHTATTLLIASGVDLKTVKEICGHADISTTMNYVHMVSGAIEKVALNFSITPSKEVSRNLRIV